MTVLRPLNLSNEDKEYILFYWKRMRECNRNALKFAREWEVRRDGLKAWCKANGLTEKNTRDKMRDDWELGDASDRWHWNRREAARCAAVIQAEYTAHRLMAGAV